MDLLILTLCAACFAVFALTLYPSVAGGDSGELIAASYHGVVAHPPGYPLFILLNRLFITIAPTLSPSWSVAYKSNLLSAIVMTICVYAIYQTQLLLLLAHHQNQAATATTTTTTTMRLIACLTAAYVAFHPLFWLYSISAEVFPLNNLLCTAFIYQTIKLEWKSNNNTRTQTLWAVTAALALANQHTSVLFVVPCVLYRMLPQLYRILSDDATTQGTSKFLEWVRAVYHIAFGFLIPFCCLYGYLAFAAKYYAPFTQMSWGGCDVATWRGLLRLILRSDYGTFQLASGAGSGKSHLPLFLALFKDFYWEVVDGVNVAPRSFTTAYSVANPPTFAATCLFALCLVVCIWAMLPQMPSLADPFKRKAEIVRQQQQQRLQEEMRDGNVRKRGKQQQQQQPLERKEAATPSPSAASSSSSSSSHRLLLFLVLFSLSFFNYLANLDPTHHALYLETVQRFWMQPAIPLMLLIGDGLHRLLLAMPSPSSHSIPLALLILLATVIIQRYPFMDHSADTTLRDYGVDVFASVPENALMLVKGDHVSNIIRYLQECESMRADVGVVVQSLIALRWHTKHLKAMVSNGAFAHPLVLPGDFLFVDPVVPTPESIFRHTRDNAYSQTKGNISALPLPYARITTNPHTDSWWQRMA